MALGFFDNMYVVSAVGTIDLKPYVVKRVMYQTREGHHDRFVASYDTHGPVSAFRAFKLHDINV